jgi:hypothetical protein
MAILQSITVKVIEQHLADINFDVVICNIILNPSYQRGGLGHAILNWRTVFHVLLSTGGQEFPWRHDYQKLSQVVIDLWKNAPDP